MQLLVYTLLIHAIFIILCFCYLTEKNHAFLHSVTSLYHNHYLPSPPLCLLVFFTVLHHILHDLSPKVAVFSTPNYDANRAIRAAVLGVGVEVGTGVRKEGNITSIHRQTHLPTPNHTFSGSVLPPSLGPCVLAPSPASMRVEPFRETDHKFEWTREQFRAWAETGSPIS